jgi:hypothetical protein
MTGYAPIFQHSFFKTATFFVVAVAIASVFSVWPAASAPKTEKSQIGRCASNCSRMKAECLRNNGINCDGFFQDCLQQVRVLGTNALICEGTPHERASQHKGFPNPFDF